MMVDRVDEHCSEPMRAVERMTVAWRQTPFARRSWFAVTLAIIFALHAGLLALLLRHDDSAAPVALEETPVEVVAQMPEPPPPDVKPPSVAKSQPSAQQPTEKAANSAPRTQNDEPADRENDESESRAPRAKLETAASPPADKPLPEDTQTKAVKEAALDPRQDHADPPTPQAQTSTPPESAPKEMKQESKLEEKAPEEAASDQPTAPPPDDAADAEALDKAQSGKAAPPEPPRRPPSLSTAPAPKPPVRPASMAAHSPRASQSSRTAIDQLAGSSDLPDYIFAKSQRKPTRFKGGSEDNRYLAVVYAMVTQSHEAIALPDGDWQVAVDFVVDGHGSLIGIDLAQSSGYPQIDAAALDAVRRAAPFPPPPSGAPTGMIARLNAAHARAAMARSR